MNRERCRSAWSLAPHPVSRRARGSAAPGGSGSGVGAEVGTPRLPASIAQQRNGLSLLFKDPASVDLLSA